MVPAGLATTLVTFEQPTRVNDSLGEAILTWSGAFPAWVSIQTIRASETLQGKIPTVDYTHIVRVLFSPQIKHDWRISLPVVGDDQPRILNIVEIINVDERNIELEILARETAVHRG